MNQDKIRKLKTIIARQEDEREAWYKHIRDIYDVSSLITPPTSKLFQGKFCPHCGAKLHVRDGQMNYYSCPSCDYEYASLAPLDMG